MYMKHNINRSFDSALRAAHKMTVMATLCLLASCTGRFELYNTNPNQVRHDQMQANNYAVGTKVVALQGLVVPVQEHQYQFIESLVGCPFGGYMGSTVNTWESRWETFNPSADWRRTTFSDVITEFYTPYRKIMQDTDDEVAHAFARLFRVAVMQRLTDCYGPIPYGDILNTEEVTVRYDSQKEVYAAMFAELEEVIATLNENETLPVSSWDKYDRVYYGDIKKWVKYANSLRLRLAMRISYADPAESERQAELAIMSGKLIQANEDNAYMHPVANKLDLIYNSWADHRISADLTCHLNGYKDPRMEKMLSPGETNGMFIGLRIGMSVAKKSEFTETFCNMKVSAGDPLLWMNAAEVSFLLAEYQLRFKKDFESARSFYEQGIRLSFEERGATGAETYIADSESAPVEYTNSVNSVYNCSKVSDCRIAWDNSGDEEANLEQIITQKWIAIFPLGNEAWAEYRRTGYPHLFPAPHNLGTDPVDLDHHARRLVYPVEEYSQNGENLATAIALLAQESVDGKGDSMATRVWWDCKPWL